MKIFVSVSSSNTPLVLVDIQPLYAKFLKHILSDVVDLLNKSQGCILFFFNGKDTGGDSKSTVIHWLFEQDVNEDVLDRIKFVEKSYGFFRGWMDLGASDATIIKAIRELFRQREWDSRDIDMEGFLASDWEDWMQNDPLIIPDISVAELKKFENCYLLGGGRNECLKEIKLLLNAFNIHHKLYEKGIY